MYLKVKLNTPDSSDILNLMHYERYQSISCGASSMLGIDSLMRYTCPQFRHIILPSFTFVFSQRGRRKGGLTSNSIECNNRSNSSSFSGDRFSGFSWGRLVFPSYRSQVCHTKGESGTSIDV